MPEHGYERVSGSVRNTRSYGSGNQFRRVSKDYVARSRRAKHGTSHNRHNSANTNVLAPKINRSRLAVQAAPVFGLLSRATCVPFPAACHNRGTPTELSTGSCNSTCNLHAWSNQAVGN